MFKRIVYCIAVFSLFLLPQNVFADSFQETLPEMVDVVFTEKDNGIKISIENFASSHEPGNPDLPYKEVRLLVPPDINPESLEVRLINEKKDIQQLNNNITPVPPLVTYVEGKRVEEWGEGKNIQQGLNVNVYEKDSYYPATHIEDVKLGQMRRWKILTFKFFPYSYNPVTKELQKVSQGVFEVSYASEITRTSMQVSTSVATDTLMDSLAQRVTSNFSRAEEWYLTSEISDMARNSLEVSEEAPGYLIVTTDTIVNESTKLQDFILQKENMGFNVMVITKKDWENISQFSFSMDKTPTPAELKECLFYESSNGPKWSSFGKKFVASHWQKGGVFEDCPYDYYTIDDFLETVDLGEYIPDGADKIKQYLMNHWETDHIQYVLFVGNPTTVTLDGHYGNFGELVPMKMVWTAYRTLPSDQFYADLTGNWDLNNNGFYGENEEFDIYNGGIDKYPEVIVGRIPQYGVMNELDAILEKMIKYETKQFGDGEWSKKVLLSMKPVDDKTPSYQLGEAIKKNVVDKNLFLSAIRVYEEKYGVSPDYIPCNYANVLDAWTKDGEGVGLHVWSTHGYMHFASSIFNAKSVEYLNDETPAFVFAVSCLNGYPEYDGNLAYELLHKGAIGVIAASRESYYYPGDTDYNDGTASGMAYRFVPRLVDLGYTMGESLSEVRIETIGIFTNWVVFNLYGDPSLAYYNSEAINLLNILEAKRNYQNEYSVDVSYQIKESGVVSYYVNEEKIYEEEKGKGEHQYTFANLNPGMHDLKVVLTGRRDTYEDSVSYFTGVKIKGHVYDVEASQAQIGKEGINVQIRNEGKTVAQITTDSTGYYESSLLQLGIYEVRAYPSYRSDVEVVGISKREVEINENNWNSLEDVDFKAAKKLVLDIPYYPLEETCLEKIDFTLTYSLNKDAYVKSIFRGIERETFFRKAGEYRHSFGVGGDDSGTHLIEIIATDEYGQEVRKAIQLRKAYRIHGQIQDAPEDGVDVAVYRGTSIWGYREETLSTDEEGKYSSENLICYDRTYTVRPYRDYYEFSPASQVIEKPYLADFTANRLNHPPVIDAIEDQSIMESKELQLAVPYSDPENDPLTVDVEGLTDWMSLADGTLTINPLEGHAGEYNLTVNVSDEEYSVSETFTLSVIPYQVEKSVLLTPDSGSILNTSHVEFTWSEGTGVEEYWLEVGTSSGGKNILGKSMGASLSAVVVNMPLKGNSVYVRLWSKIEGKWEYNDYQYETESIADESAGLLTPEWGTEIKDSTVTFTWSPGVGVTRYQIGVGTTRDSIQKSPWGDISFQDVGTVTTATVTEIPISGQDFYVRLWSKMDGKWVYRDYAFRTTVPPRPAELISPEEGTVLTSPHQEFRFSQGVGVYQMYLRIGTTLDGDDIQNTKVWNNKPVLANNIPITGNKIYVKFSSEINREWHHRRYVFDTYKEEYYEMPEIASPTPGILIRHTQGTFRWSTGVNISEYRLTIGSSEGANDIFDQSTGGRPYVAVTGLPLNGEPIYVRLYGKVANKEWKYTDYIYQTYNYSDHPAEMESPVLGEILATKNVQFMWSEGRGVTEYWLELGTTQGGKDVFSKSTGTSRGYTVEGIPLTGEPLYARLWSRIDGEWEHKDYEYATENIPDEPAKILTPTIGIEIESSPVTFTWSSEVGATAYQLGVGTSKASVEKSPWGDISFQDVGSATTATVTGIPINGQNFYVRLWSQVSGKWLYRDYVYQTRKTLAEMQAPKQGTVLSDSSVAFNWSAGMGVDGYWLNVGTILGGTNILEKDMGNNLSYTVTNIPLTGELVYVRLLSLIDGQWEYKDYQYQTEKLPDAPAEIVHPVEGTLLATRSMDFLWSAGRGVRAYQLTIGTTSGGADIIDEYAGRELQMRVENIPLNGRPVYVRIYSIFEGGQSTYKEYVYETREPSYELPQIISPTPGLQFRHTRSTFRWSSGINISEYRFTVGTQKGGTDIFDQKTGGRPYVDVLGIPLTGERIYVRLYGKVNDSEEWKYTDYFYDTEDMSNRAAEMQSPAQGTMLTTTTVQFLWNEGRGVEEYWLELGTTLGGKNIFSKSTGTSRGYTVTGILLNGETVYARLWSKIDGRWEYKDYNYQTKNIPVELAEIQSPVNGSSLSTSSVNFSWSLGLGVSEYWIEVGTSQGGKDILSKSTGANTSYMVTGIPLSGESVYLRLWSKVNGKWHYKDYSYGTTYTPPALGEIQTPSPGSILNDTIVWFSWKEGEGVSEYWLQAGATIGGKEIVDRSLGTNTSSMVNGIELNGKSVYVRLWSKVNGKWLYKDYTYQTENQPPVVPEIQTPANGATLSGSTVTFTWTAGTNVTGYQIGVGTSPGSLAVSPWGDIGFQDVGMVTSATISELPMNGLPVYVRLWAKISGKWVHKDYQFNTAAQ